MVRSAFAKGFRLSQRFAASNYFYYLYNRKYNFSLLARYSLKFARCSLLVVKSLVTYCKIRSLLVIKVAHCKKSLVTRCKIRLLLVAKVARYKKSLVTCRRSCSLLVAKVKLLFATFLKSDSSTGVFL